MLTGKHGGPALLLRFGRPDLLSKKPHHDLLVSRLVHDPETALRERHFCDLARKTARFYPGHAQPLSPSRNRQRQMADRIGGRLHGDFDVVTKAIQAVHELALG